MYVVCLRTWAWNDKVMFKIAAFITTLSPTKTGMKFPQRLNQRLGDNHFQGTRSIIKFTLEKNVLHFVIVIQWKRTEDNSSLETNGVSAPYHIVLDFLETTGHCRIPFTWSYIVYLQSLQMGSCY